MSNYPALPHLLVIYGLCFGIQNKLPWLQGRFQWLDTLLGCSYCVGFHTGWIIWCLDQVLRGFPLQGGLAVAIPTLLIWALSSSAFCYLVDVCATRLER